MSNKICPNCGTAQPESRKSCISCGHELDSGVPYAGPPIFVKPRWYNVAAVFAFLTAAATLAVIALTQGGYSLWISILCEIVVGLNFIFPIQSYRFWSRRYVGFKRAVPDDYDSPEKVSIIIQTVLSCIVWALNIILTAVYAYSQTA